MNILFESNVDMVTAPNTPNAEIIWHEAPYIQYEKIKLDDNFK